MELQAQLFALELLVCSMAVDKFTESPDPQAANAGFFQRCRVTMAQFDHMTEDPGLQEHLQGVHRNLTRLERAIADSIRETGRPAPTG